MAVPNGALSASQAARSPALRYLVAVALFAPLLLVVLLLMLLGGGLAHDAGAAPAAPAVLRPGAVPPPYELAVELAARTCPGVTAPLLAAQLEAESGWQPDAEIGRAHV